MTENQDLAPTYRDTNRGLTIPYYLSRAYSHSQVNGFIMNIALILPDFNDYKVRMADRIGREQRVRMAATILRPSLGHAF